MAFSDSAIATGASRWVKRDTADCLTGAAVNLFDVAGLVNVKRIIGRVTTAIQAQACTAGLSFDPDDGGSNVEITDVTTTPPDLTGDAIGTIYYSDGTIGNDMANALDCTFVPEINMTCYDGKLIFTTSADNTGSIEWYIEYVPISTDASITAV